MAAPATESKKSYQIGRPLPPTPQEPPVAEVAKNVLKSPPAKAPARVRCPSFYLSARPLSGNFTIPADPSALSTRITRLIFEASDPTVREQHINQARELLDEMFVQSVLSDEDTQTRKEWFTSLRMGYEGIRSFAKLYKMETSEASVVLLCKKILDQLELELREPEPSPTTETTDISDPVEYMKKILSGRTDWRITQVALGILAVAGLLFAARIGIHRFLARK